MYVSPEESFKIEIRNSISEVQDSKFNI